MVSELNKDYLKDKNESEKLIVKVVKLVKLDDVKLIMKTISLYLSTIHASVSGICALLYCLNIVNINVYLSILYFSKKYFCVDTFFGCFIYDVKNFIMYTVHHVLAYFIVKSCIFIIEESYNDGNMNYYDNKIVNGIAQSMTAEIPIILLNINYMLYKKNGIVNKKIFHILEIIQLILYLIFRVMNYSFMLYHYNNLGYNIQILVITLMNYVWFYILLKRFFIQNKKKIN